MASTESPLLTALPPNTDYISYLTIVEQYLNKENLPILLQVLQDETLTINIGWDLIQLLLPLLPESKDCLEVIARLGNPREVILKVTEALRLIDYDGEDSQADAGALSSELNGIDGQTRPATSTGQRLPLVIEQFEVLLSLLATLHARIKTKYPSRFISTTLQAILASFSNSTSHREDMVVSIVQTIKQIRGIRRPALPSRSSSSTLSRTATSSSQQQAQDPEASTSSMDPDEAALQLKLFQSFATHVVEDYLTNLDEVNGLAYMAWSTRLTEHTQPERLLPVSHGKTMSARFSNDFSLRSRVDAIGQLASLSQDLNISDSELLQAIHVDEQAMSDNDGEEEPPPSAADVPLSSIGSALLYATKQISAALYGRSVDSTSSFRIFPEHERMIRAVLSQESSQTLGHESLALIDASIALGLLALTNNQIGEPDSDAQFEDYLKLLALVASNCPEPALRGHAHYLASTVLRSHPDDAVRVDFIRDVLENSPMENLKPIAVGWLKGEIIEAAVTATSAQNSKEPGDVKVEAVKTQLDDFASLVFPALPNLLHGQLESAWQHFQVQLPFYLASLNFLYLLVYSEPLRNALDSKSFVERHAITTRFVKPLQEAGLRFQSALQKNDQGFVDGVNESDKDGLIAELNVLAETIERLDVAFGRI